MVKIKTESAVIDVDVDAQVGYASPLSAILILVVLIGRLLLPLRRVATEVPWSLLLDGRHYCRVG
jgi:hypothetical protein